MSIYSIGLIIGNRTIFIESESRQKAFGTLFPGAKFSKVCNKLDANKAVLEVRLECGYHRRHDFYYISSDSPVQPNLRMAIDKYYAYNTTQNDLLRAKVMRYNCEYNLKNNDRRTELFRNNRSNRLRIPWSRELPILTNKAVRLYNKVSKSVNTYCPNAYEFTVGYEIYSEMSFYKCHINFNLGVLYFSFNSDEELYIFDCRVKSVGYRNINLYYMGVRNLEIMHNGEITEQWKEFIGFDSLDIVNSHLDTWLKDKKYLSSVLENRNNYRVI